MVGLDVQQKLAAARTKLQQYRAILESTYGEVLRLRTYSVVAVGLERLVWEEGNLQISK